MLPLVPVSEPIYGRIKAPGRRPEFDCWVGLASSYKLPQVLESMVAEMELPFCPTFRHGRRPDRSIVGPNGHSPE